MGKTFFSSSEEKSVLPQGNLKRESSLPHGLHQYCQVSSHSSTQRNNRPLVHHGPAARWLLRPQSQYPSSALRQKRCQLCCRLPLAQAGGLNRKDKNSSGAQMIKPRPLDFTLFPAACCEQWQYVSHLGSQWPRCHFCVRKETPRHPRQRCASVTVCWDDNEP